MYRRTLVMKGIHEVPAGIGEKGGILSCVPHQRRAVDNELSSIVHAILSASAGYDHRVARLDADIRNAALLPRFI